MYLLFSSIHSTLGERYKIVENNIKNKNASFYSSCLELFEALLKQICIEQGIKLEEGYTTAGGILTLKNFKSFASSIGISKDIYEQSFKLIKYVNDFKHDEVHNLTLEQVIECLKTLYLFAFSYAKSKNKSLQYNFDIEKISSIYGWYEKEINNLENQKQKAIESLTSEQNQKYLLKQDIAKIKEIADSKELRILSGEKKYNELLKQNMALKDIKLSTMEEKIVKITNILEAQTGSMKKQYEAMCALNNSIEQVIELLKKADKQNWGGRHTVYN